jgi:probable HAF family extracellular repeat protein
MWASISAVAANAPAPVFHFFDYPGSTQTHLSNVSSNNIAVGWYVDSANLQRGFVARNGKLTSLDAPNGFGGTLLEDVNASGTVVGYYVDVNGNAHGFSYAGSVFTDVGPPGAEQAYANGIDDLGRITGQFLDTDGVFKGWIFDGTTYQIIWIGFSSNVFDINESGLATVTWQDSSNLYEAAIYDGHNFTAINVPGALHSLARGISSGGDVALYWTNDQVHFHAAVLVGRKFKKFDAPGCDSTRASGINDRHVIVGACKIGLDYKAFYVTY